MFKNRGLELASCYGYIIPGSAIAWAAPWSMTEPVFGYATPVPVLGLIIAFLGCLRLYRWAWTWT